MAMLTAYFDDSNIRQGPVYVLAGWVAATEIWRAFSTEWQSVLEMRPQVSYFKYSEARNFAGEFSGISKESRDEKLMALVRVLEDYNVVGISASIPDNVFRGWFAPAPKPYNNPYLMLFYGAIGRLLRYANSINNTGPIEFIFDTQVDQMGNALSAWDQFVADAPPEFARMLDSPPAFRSDIYAIPLQAADLHAGWLREMNTEIEIGRPAPEPAWGFRGKNIRREYNFMEWWHAAETFERIFGKKPTTYTFTTKGTDLSSPPRLHLPSWPP